MENKWIESKTVFLKKIIFAKTWEKISSSGFRKYFQSMFCVENLLFKAILTALIAILVLGLGFGLRDYFLGQIPSPVVINTGIAYSNLSSVGKTDPAVVYGVESIPLIIALLAFIFVPKWYAASGFTMMFFGGLTNIIDRSVVKTFWTMNPNYPAIPGTRIYSNGMHETRITNGVADYFHGIHSIFNIADVFVIMGVCLGVVGILIWIGISVVRENRGTKNKPVSGQ